MRDKDIEASPGGGRYMSPLVKQDLARLDRDGESRRSAMNSLKNFVENLDPGSMPRFLAQVSESRDQGGSRSYAVSLYEEVARVHGKLIIPYVPRVMASVVRSLSSSGSSPQLHQACARVVSAVARHSIDGGNPAQADEILWQLCEPLLGVLAGKIEPLAAGAAVCMQDLVECDEWKYASHDVVREACLRTTVALGEKATRTVAHLQLARSLAIANSSCFNNYGVSLLRTGAEVLCQSPACGTWQQRACAARLLQAVLPTVDKPTLASELDRTVQALDECKHDRMAGVRTAVCDALKTAKLLSSPDFKSAFDGESSFPGTPYLSSIELDDNQPSRSSSNWKRIVGGASAEMSGSWSRRGVPVGYSSDSVVSISPSASPGSPPVLAQGSPFGKPRRSPLSPAVHFARVQQTSLVRDGAARLGNCLNSSAARSCEVQAKENMPSRNLDVNAGGAPPGDCGPSSVESSPSSHHGKHVRSIPPVSPGLIVNHVPRKSTDQTLRDMEPGPDFLSNDRRANLDSSFGNSVITAHRSQDGANSTAEEEEMSLNSNVVDIEVESGTDFKILQPDTQRVDGSNQFNTFNGDAKFVTGINTLMHSQMGSNGSPRVNLFPPEENGDQSTNPRTKQICGTQSADARLRDSRQGHHRSESDPSCIQRAMDSHSPLRHSRNLDDVSSPESERAIITAEDFLPDSTPRRLVRSLQTSVSSPVRAGSGADMEGGTGWERPWIISENPTLSNGALEANSEKHEERKQGMSRMSSPTATGIKLQDGGGEAEMDVDTSSENAWSVRDNPMASDDSFKADSEGDDKDKRKGTGGRHASKRRGGLCRLSTDCERISYALIEAAESLYCASTGMGLGADCSNGDLDIVANRESGGGLQVNDVKDEGKAQALRDDVPSTNEVSELFKCVCCGQPLSPFENSECGVCLRGRSEGDTCASTFEMDRKVGVLHVRFRLSVRDTLGKTLRSVEGLSEVFLRGFLLVVLAIPLAMILSRLFWPPSEQQQLVPT